MSGKYDRNHSAADWSGYVATMPSKKHIKTPPSQLKAADDGTGIVPTDGKTKISFRGYSP